MAAPAKHPAKQPWYEPIIKGIEAGINNDPNSAVAGSLAATGDITGGTSGVTGFLGQLSSGNLWLRVGEFAVGSIMLYVGLKGLFPSQVATVTALPAKVAKVGAFAA